MSRRKRSCLHPLHPLWPAFRIALARYLKLDEDNRDPVCAHRPTMGGTVRALAEVGLAQRNVLPPANCLERTVSPAIANCGSIPR